MNMNENECRLNGGKKKDIMSIPMISTPLVI